jgi:phosphomannomutase
MKPVNLGQVPTPALTLYAIQHRCVGIMVTGSHIPFHRNGYKTCGPRGELLKTDEAPIAERVAAVRRRVYEAPYDRSPFDRHGMFKTGHCALSGETSVARQNYLQRYIDFFADRRLSGKRILVYQHSAVGRDMLVELLASLGADAIAAGRSDTFVPIDTENIDAALMRDMQQLADDAAAVHGPLVAVVSTDGDSDRPLILGVDAGKIRFFAGDLVGMIVADYLGADAVVVPISCNDAIDRAGLRDRLQPKTKIGSPYVIAGMEAARARGKKAVCGWEANGGFLVGSNISTRGRFLRALPTRDAFLPILCVLFAAHERSVAITEMFEQLPQRHGKAALMARFPKRVSQEIVGRFSPTDVRVINVGFHDDEIGFSDSDGAPLDVTDADRQAVGKIRDELRRVFTGEDGFTGIAALNYTDGVRITFECGDIAHIRPSGNADELRIYAVADSHARAEEIARLGVAEPDGLLRRLERLARHSAIT